MAYVNSWNMSLVEINGVDFTNVWSNNMPAPIDGKWYIHFMGQYAWSHFEAPAAKSAEGDLIEEFVSDINIYPNPANDILNLESNILIKDISLVSITGKVVVSKNNLDTHSISIKTNELPSGIYILKVKTDESLVLKRLIIN